jgi:hypothetical protein
VDCFLGGHAVTAGTPLVVEFESIRMPLEALAVYVSLFAGQRGAAALLAWLRAELTADLEQRIKILEDKIQ